MTKHTIETVTFKLVDGISREAFAKDAEAITDFARKQPGFVSRRLPLLKAQHEPLISFSTHQIILDRLNQKPVPPARQGISSEFPLRGFLTCEHCGHKLTSCWSTGRSGTKYPYYL